MRRSRHAALCCAALCFAGAGSTEAACVPQLGGFYQFWQADGNAYDSHGTNHGILRNGATYAPGKVGLGFSFDGVDDFVEIPDNNIYVSGTSFFTIEFWAKFNALHPGTLAAPGTIFLGNDEGAGNRDKWFFGLGGGVLFFHVNTLAGPPRNLAQAAFTPVTNQWYHLAVRRTSFSTYKIYINGVESGSEANTNAIPNTIAPVTLGQAENTGFLNGQLDEVTIYNYDLTPAELQATVNVDTNGIAAFAFEHNEDGSVRRNRGPRRLLNTRRCWTTLESNEKFRACCRKRLNYGVPHCVVTNKARTRITV